MLKKSKKQQRIWQHTIAHFLLVIGSILFLLPVVWMISTSLKTDPQVFLFPPVWIPNPVDWTNYPEAIIFIPFFTYSKNTLIYCMGAALGTLISCSLVAYSFSRIRWPGRDFLFILTLSTMMIPFQVTMIPLFIIFRKIGWVGTLRPLIVPSFFGIPFFIFLLRQFFMTIPSELTDAAKIDGASEFRIFLEIILPLSKPVLAVVALFRFMWAWHDFLGPLIYLNHQSTFTLSLGLKLFQGQYGTEWALLMAASTLITLPVIILFFFTQKTFVQGIALTGLKG